MDVEAAVAVKVIVDFSELNSLGLNGVFVSLFIEPFFRRACEALFSGLLDGQGRKLGLSIGLLFLIGVFWVLALV